MSTDDTHGDCFTGGMELTGDFFDEGVVIGGEEHTVGEPAGGCAGCRDVVAGDVDAECPDSLDG